MWDLAVCASQALRVTRLQAGVPRWSHLESQWLTNSFLQPRSLLWLQILPITSCLFKTSLWMPTRHLKCEVSKNKLLISPSKTFFVIHCIEPAFTNVLGQKSSAPSIAPPTSSHDQPCPDYCQQPLIQTPCFPPRPHYSPLNCQNDLFKAWTKSRHSLPLLPDGGITLHLDSYILVITYKALYKQALGYPLIQLPTHSALSPPDYALAQELPDWPLHLLFALPGHLPPRHSRGLLLPFVHWVTR